MREKISIPGRYGNISAILRRPSDERNTVYVMSHGLTSNKDTELHLEFEDELYKHGLGSLRYDCFGHGESDGELSDLTITKALDTLRVSVDYAREKCDCGVGLVGTSFGGIASIVKAAEDKDILAMVLNSPITDSHDFCKYFLGGKKLDKWREKGVLQQDFCGEHLEFKYDLFLDAITYDTLKIAEDIEVPTFIIHGKRDKIVPYSQSKKLVKRMNGRARLKLLPKHNHSAKDQYDRETSDEIMEFTEKYSI